jgi:hypothetical protein
MRGEVSRRQFLLAASGGAMAILGSGTVVGLYFDYPLRRWIARIVRSHLPGVAISDSVMKAYTDDVLIEATSQRSITRLAALANLVAPGLHLVNDQLKRPVDDFERYLVSGFLLQSNFFEVDDPLKAEIRYLGKRICSNPFARFD